MTSAIVNTHVHIPPNFSAFTTVSDVVHSAAEQGVRALGVSNFYDQRVYALIRDLTAAAGILPLYGLEFITLVPDLAEQGIRINDPANPGRMYLTGKGIDPFADPTPRASKIAQQIRQGNDERAREMVSRLAAHVAACGFETGLTAELIAEQVAEQGEVPVEWVSLQERHIARAFQEALGVLDPVARSELLSRVYGSDSKVGMDDPVGLQGEIRSRLLKVGTPGFAPEVALSFDDAYAYILDMGGIPCYPILADGANPICPFEESAPALAEELIRRGIYAAELIPPRNARSVARSYVDALRDAGLIVMAGTEHNTADRIPLDPFFADGEFDDDDRAGFFSATAIVAAHGARTRDGRDGYVDRDGRRTSVDPADLIAEGTALIEHPPVVPGLE